ncbi:MAG: 30S ribosomal protein S9 [Anaerolineales bacterium]|nr:30S ribosomal protein S9 [Anaerolineales bacterium]MCX7608866.1 30S ribosomal protein S9 [Anaerolineales bacterium]MDW8226293.1 30S ribosomal protein S9 [Anaerolineales bacterium]
MSVRYYEGVGRRKEAVARVRVMAGSGRFIVNQKDALAYFTRLGDMEALLLPFQAVGHNQKAYDVTVVVRGGGISGQRDAVKLGLARALLKMDSQLGPILRKYGLLTRDPRAKERKKPGLKRARKAPTYTKR